MNKRFEKFIEKSKQLHGDKYDYSLVDYKNARTKVKIICSIHGIFEQRPDNHNNRGDGCPECNINKKLSFLEFENRSHKKHNNKYLYNENNYKNTISKTKIFCPIHGIFEQNAGKHLNGDGCSSCAGNKKLDVNTFIKRSKEIHADKYDYKNVEYKNNFTNVKIICPEHGLFEQNPNNHMKGCGCSKCSLEKQQKEKIENRTHYGIIFIEKANKIHNNKYSYDDTLYVNCKTNIKIVCSEHGVFEQQPLNHSSGQGCPLCAEKQRRLKRIERIKNDKFNGYQVIPSYNREACKLFDKLSHEKNIHIQHAMNGGEYHIKELGYWVDGYDKENNTVYEFDEKRHFIKGKLKEKDRIRQKEITNLLECKFIRIKDK